MANEANNANPTNGRIVALNGKFANHKTLGLGQKDATFRFGKNIPADMPDNFSAGYTGKAIVDLSDNYRGEETND